MPVLLERKRPSDRQLKAVRTYIMRRRKQEKQALAESKAKEEEAMLRKREQEKKKETVEDVKVEISKLEEKLESLKNEKHELFLQLKKVLNEESEQKRQRELQMQPAFHQPLMATSVHRMPYVMVGPRPMGTIAGNAAPLQGQTLHRLETPGVNQMHPQPYPPNQVQTPTPYYPQPNSSLMLGSEQSHMAASHIVTSEKNLKVSSGQSSGTESCEPLHVVTNPSSLASQHSPHSQILAPKGDKHHDAVKLLSPKTSSLPTSQHSYLHPHGADPLSHQGRPINQPTMYQLQSSSKHQIPSSQQSSLTSSINTKPDSSHQFKHSSQSQSKPISYPVTYPKSEQSQSMHNKLQAKSTTPQPKEQPQQHKNSYSSHTEAIKQEPSLKNSQQLGIHNYPVQQQVSTSGTYLHALSSSHNIKQPSTTYPTKPNQESDPKKNFQIPTSQNQQSYGYSLQQQPSSYSDHQMYLSKSQAPAQAVTQVSYPTTGQQTYQGYSKDQSTAYPQQQHSYPSAYSGQQYQGYLSQQYQAQPYHGYPIQSEYKGQTQNYAPQQQPTSSKATSRSMQYEQSKHDPDMPPPPPQKPPPKQDQDHHHQSSKRSAHRYSGHAYKREHHSTSSSKSKFSEKYSSSHDDHPSSSRHSHYHSSSKSSHSKGSSSSSSSSSRQSRYH